VKFEIRHCCFDSKCNDASKRHNAMTSPESHRTRSSSVGKTKRECTRWTGVAQEGRRRDRSHKIPQKTRLRSYETRQTSYVMSRDLTQCDELSGWHSITTSLPQKETAACAQVEASVHISETRTCASSHCWS
jgi:hypothetical protein